MIPQEPNGTNGATMLTVCAYLFLIGQPAEDWQKLEAVHLKGISGKSRATMSGPAKATSRPTARRSSSRPKRRARIRSTRCSSWISRPAPPAASATAPAKPLAAISIPNSTRSSSLPAISIRTQKSIMKLSARPARRRRPRRSGDAMSGTSIRTWKSSNPISTAALANASPIPRATTPRVPIPPTAAHRLLLEPLGRKEPGALHHGRRRIEYRMR